MNDPASTITTISVDGRRLALRKRMLAQRQALCASERQTLDMRIFTALEARLAEKAPGILGAYWPMRAEVDIRPLMHHAHARGITVALPQVIAADQPLHFVRWTPQTTLRESAQGAVVTGEIEEVTPQLLLVPCVGFDARRYRLGYGGGFYDRTLAVLRITAWGLAYECCRVANIYPQAHDIALDAIFTEDAVYE